MTISKGATETLCPYCQDAYNWLVAVPSDQLDLHAQHRWPGKLIHVRRWHNSNLGEPKQVACEEEMS